MLIVQKSYARSNQVWRVTSCKRFFHLSCLGDGFEVTRFCHQCLENDSGAEETSEWDEPFIPLKLGEVVKLRGHKIVRQNMQSLSDKIDQLRLLFHGLHSGIQLITRSESWLRPNRNDSEYEILGYTLFRKERKGNNGGVAVYARKDLVLTRRDELEVDSVEGLWLEIAMPKSRGFLVGSFYRPDRSFKDYDEDFMAKLNCILDTATADDKEILLFGNFNCCFMSAHRNSECKQLKTLFKSLNFKQLINSLTKILRYSKSLIDLIAVNYPQNICDSGVVSANLSVIMSLFLVSERSIGGKLQLNSRPLETMLIIIRVISGGTLKVLLGTLFLSPMGRLSM